MYNTAQAWLGMFYADLHNRITNVGRDEEGQAMAEYALVLAIIAVGAIITLGFLSGAINGALDQVKDAL